MQQIRTEILALGTKFSKIILGIVLWDRDEAGGRKSRNPNIQEKDVCEDNVLAFFTG